MSDKRENKKRRVFNMYNLLVLLSVAVIIGAGYVLLERQGVDVASYLPINEVKEFFGSNEKEDKDVEDIPVVASSSDDDTSKSARSLNKATKAAEGEISEEDAKRIAKGQFETLGETNVDVSELDVMKIERKEEKYYYVTSKNSNTVEIKISDGTIARVNGVVTE